MRAHGTSALSWTICALLGLSVWLVFRPVLEAEFVQWDDDLNIYANPHIRGLGMANLRWMFTDTSYARRYMPLAWLNWAVHNKVAGLTPPSCHGGNLLFHSLNAVLVFLLIRRLLELGSKSTAARQSTLAVCAALGALLWAVHPLRVEAVAWASARIYQQALLFALLSLLAYLRFAARSPAAGKRIGFYWASVALFAASVLTHPIGLMIGLGLLILDVYPLRRWPQDEAGSRTAGSLRIVLEKVPFFAVMGLALGVTLCARFRASGIFEPPVSLQDFGPVSRMAQAFYIWTYFLWKTWAPINLAPAYSALVWFSPVAWPFVLSMFLVPSVTLLLWLMRKSCPVAWSGWIWYLVLLVPLLGLTEHPHYTSDRYSYLVSLVWSVWISAGLLHWADRAKIWAGAMTACVVLALVWGTMSFRQTRVWHDSVSLFGHALAKLGKDRYRGDLHWRLGRVLAEKGQWEGAISNYSAALEALPLFAAAHESWAEALEAQNQAAAALSHLEWALQIQPTAQRHFKLAQALGRLGQYAAATVHYREALRQVPNSPEGLNNLAWILATAGDASIRNGREAVEMAERACALIHYEKAIFVGTLAAAYAEAGRFEEAIQTAEKARTLALASGENELAATNQRLLELYRQRAPFRQPME